jgi:hypothetical protein
MVCCGGVMVNHREKTNGRGLYSADEEYRHILDDSISIYLHITTPKPCTCLSSHQHV